MTSDPSISVIVPVHNGGAHLNKCLDALRASELPAHEIIVVDDCSTEDTLIEAQPSALTAAASSGAELRLFRLGSKLGPAAARNFGAIQARGDVLLFVDSDVVIRKGTLERIAALFRSQPGVAAVFGSYDDSPAEPNFVSQHKNLLHHFVHQESSPEAVTFWTGCGAIRRKVFAAIGGFNETKYVTPSIEDIEFGYRLRCAGFRIVLDKELQVKHLKRWTFSSLIRADVFSRALPWSRLILERGEIINDLNLRVRERVCAALIAGAVGLVALSYFSLLFLLAALAALTLVFFINFRLYRFLLAKRGVAFAARSFAMHALYYFYSTTVFSLCYAQHAFTRMKGIIRPARTLPKSGLVKDA